MYFARTLALEPGTTHSFDRFYEEEANPITLHVLRKDTTDLPLVNLTFHLEEIREGVPPGGRP